MWWFEPSLPGAEWQPCGSWAHAGTPVGEAKKLGAVGEEGGCQQSPAKVPLPTSFSPPPPLSLPQTAAAVAVWRPGPLHPRWSLTQAFPAARRTPPACYPHSTFSHGTAEHCTRDLAIFNRASTVPRGRTPPRLPDRRVQSSCTVSSCEGSDPAAPSKQRSIRVPRMRLMAGQEGSAAARGVSFSPWEVSNRWPSAEVSGCR